MHMWLSPPAIYVRSLRDYILNANLHRYPNVNNRGINRGAIQHRSNNRGVNRGAIQHR